MPSSYGSEVHDCTAEESVPSSHGSEVQNCRKRPPQLQIQGSAWANHARKAQKQAKKEHAWHDFWQFGEQECVFRVVFIGLQVFKDLRC